LDRLGRWITGVLTGSPPHITGLWFGLFNPMIDDRPTADLHVLGAPYSATDRDWIFRDRWGQGGPSARSGVLSTIYSVAYSTHGGLGNDAEYPLCLAYAALAVRHVAETIPAVVRGEAERRVLFAGFDSGDFLCIGAVTGSGLIISREREVMV